MTNQTSAAVCRSVSLKHLQSRDGYYGETKKVTPVPVPDKRTPVKDFLSAVLPNAKIEHVGRLELAGVVAEGGYRRPATVAPSSLFYQALHQAYAEHHPFAIRPEVLMYLITANVAEAVKRDPESFRSLFTTNAAGTKETILVRHDGLRRGDPESPWGDVFPMFNGKLREKVPAGIMDHMLPGFTTATAESDCASMISFMDAASPFYDYRVMTRCGLPEIRLLGTPEDWQKLKNAAAALAEPFSKPLGAYFQHLLPVLATLAKQAAGEPVDEEFWASMYKWEDESGGPKFNGWSSAFLNFIQVDGKLVAKHERTYDWKKHGWGTGLPSGCAPSHVSAVPFIWDYYGTEIKMTFAGGVLGCDVEDGYLTPALSYAVLEAAK